MRKIQFRGTYKNIKYIYTTAGFFIIAYVCLKVDQVRLLILYLKNTFDIDVIKFVYIYLIVYIVYVFQS
jgi:hypothetical protein